MLGLPALSATQTVRHEPKEASRQRVAEWALRPTGMIEDTNKEHGLLDFQNQYIQEYRLRHCPSIVLVNNRIA